MKIILARNSVYLLIKLFNIVYALVAIFLLLHSFKLLIILLVEVILYLSTQQDITEA
jgi:hypothetical protein